MAGEFFDCFLDDEPTAAASLEAKNSFVFYIVSTESNHNDHIANHVQTVRIQHRRLGFSKGGAPLPPLYFSDVDDCKPKLSPLLPQMTTTTTPPSSATANPTKSSTRDLATSGANQGALVRASRTGFTSKVTGNDILKIMPMQPQERACIDRARSFIPVLKMYAHRYEHGSHPPNDMYLDIISVCLALVEDLTVRSGAAGRHDNKTAFVNEANALPANSFAELYGGEPNKEMQEAARQTKLRKHILEWQSAPSLC
jgi:hypothetical protein